MSTNSEKLIGIIGAMKVEIDDVKSRVENPVTETVSGIDFVSGTLDGVPVVVAMCGVGKVFAAMCVQTMILKYSPTLVINIGVGGSLSKNLNVGDIAIANALCQHDMDTSAVECGNYRTLNLEAAKKEFAAYLEVLKNVRECDFVYKQ